MRFGVQDFKLIDFFPIHNICEQFSDTLDRSLWLIVEKYYEYFKKTKHSNIVGEQLFTHEDYDIENAITSINGIKAKYDISIYAEPNEAIIYDMSYIIASIIYILYNSIKTAIIDTPMICHMPDIFFSKYQSEIIGNRLPKKNISIQIGRLNILCRRYFHRLLIFRISSNQWKIGTIHTRLVRQRIKNVNYVYE